MKLVSYLHNNSVNLGAIVRQGLIALPGIYPGLPNDIIQFLQLNAEIINKTEQLIAEIEAGQLPCTTIENYTLIAPVPRPNSCRDG